MAIFSLSEADRSLDKKCVSAHTGMISELTTGKERFPLQSLQLEKSTDCYL